MANFEELKFHLENIILFQWLKKTKKDLSSALDDGIEIEKDFIKEKLSLLRRETGKDISEIREDSLDF